MRNMRDVLASLVRAWTGGFAAVVRELLRRCRRKRDRKRQGREGREARARCVPIDHPAFVRPDPLLYAQYDLMDKGLAVTWDNPDITVRRNGQVVPSHLLEAATEYEVVARIWNASTDGPAIQVPTHFTMFGFGVGTEPVSLGTEFVTVGVIGSPTNPAFVSVPWTTPAEPGHYCLQVRLDPADDTNHANNLGQENTDVGVAASPAEFSFALRNNTLRKRRYRFEVDGYALGERAPCDESRRRRLERHRRGSHPLPDGWTVAIEPEHPALAPDEQIAVAVLVTPPDAWSGAQAVNVNAFHDAGLAGGVTLTVVREEA